MNRPTQSIILGAITVVSVITLIITSYVIPVGFSSSIQQKSIIEQSEVWQQISGIASLALLLFYFLYAIFSPRIPKEKRYLWAALILFGNYIIIPFFWYNYFWKVHSGENSNGAT